MNETIELTVKVMNYVPNAMSDEYDSGGFAVYDATVLQVISPVEKVGSELTIYHNQPPQEDSIWRRVGCQIRFKIYESLIGEGRLVFAAGAMEIQIL